MFGGVIVVCGGVWKEEGSEGGSQPRALSTVVSDKVPVVFLEPSRSEGAARNQSLLSST